MKLQRLPAAHSDYSAQSVAHLGEKYLGRAANAAQVAFGGRTGGKYPPSRDHEFSIQRENDEFNAELQASGGHGVPLTKYVSPSLSLRLPPPHFRTKSPRLSCPPSFKSRLFVQHSSLSTLDSSPAHDLPLLRRRFPHIPPRPFTPPSLPIEY
jgi:hypothetical protein